MAENHIAVKHTREALLVSLVRRLMVVFLQVYPGDIYAFGLVAWTGNDVLNRRLRLQAESKGFRLDDTRLFLATQG
ncbi:DNA polymerase lambda-like isoform X2 [Cicer arietinum]|uniref:DNA polymerase lambda-like isoform X2 n=1 Tax=Cicer arietinum TaxID=3827 RepID=UPI003CC5B7AF